jgi:hypothetical protein
VLPLRLQDSSLPPSKNRNSSLLIEGKKEAIGTTRILQGVTYPAYPSLRNTTGAPGGKKTSKY